MEQEGIYHGSDIPKEIVKNLLDYLQSPAMARTHQQLYASQAHCWWQKPTIF